MSRLRALWWHLSASLWFIPSLTVLGATVLAVALVELDGMHQLELAKRFPRLFGTGAEGARGMLSAIASSMITVAGVVFSVTIVALSLAASQYSPRVLRSFMADRPTQAVLGVFVGVFAYCLVVLRTIRAGDEGFVPPLAVAGGIALAFVAIGFLVYFIHHLAASIQAAAILERVSRGTRQAIEALFPDELGAEVDETADEAAEVQAGPWTPAPAAQSGYIVTVDNEGLLGFAREEGRVLRMELAVGEFAIRGQPIVSLHGNDAVREDALRRLSSLYALEGQRTIEQDAGFGLQQMVDVGLKALSPGINDQSTAVTCIDRLADVVVLLARRRVERRLRRDDEALRVIALGPTFAGLVSLAFEDLRDAGGDKAAVLERLLWALERVATATINPQRRAVLAAQVERIAECARRNLRAPHRREAVLARAARLTVGLQL
jgi:uncharacterized membrane protein